MLESLSHNWLIFNILSSFCVGLFSFFNKVTIERKHNENLTLLFLYGNQIWIAFMLVLFFGNHSFNSKTFFLATIASLFLLIVYKSRFIALKNIDSSTYFTNFRIISSTLLLFIGYLFFNDTLSFREIFGFALGIGIFFLLFEKQKHASNRHYKKSILALLTSIIFITFFGTILKIVSLGEINFFNFIFYESIVSLSIMLILGRKKISSGLFRKNILLKETFKLSLFQAILQILIAPLFLYALYLGADLGIAYKIQSYSIFIPIILSIIIYKERFTKKKIIALILTIISIQFFL